MRGVTPYVLRGVALVVLVLLIWNPGISGDTSLTAPPLVLLDASLSMAAAARWPEALRAARGAAGREGVVWRFGRIVSQFDTTAPAQGATRLAPALAAAAARAGPIVVITDGEIDDATALAPDLARRPRVVLVPRKAPRDFFVSRLGGPRRVSGNDTLRLTVAYGTAGASAPRGGAEDARLVVRSGGAVLLTRPVVPPDSGTLTTELTLAAARLASGPQALEVRIEVPGDPEPRDDARLWIVDVSPRPAVVVLAAPPGWETRFLAVALEAVARVPVRVFVRLGRQAVGWRDARTLGAVGDVEVAGAVRLARLLVTTGGAPVPGGVPATVSRLRIESAGARDGDWYVRPAAVSPLAGMLTGIDWDALPPATGLAPPTANGGAIVVLEASLARRGTAQPGVVLRERGGAGGRVRSAAIHATGLWRWQFRGGQSAVAYRAVVAALVDWLLQEGGEGAVPDRVAPAASVVANGLPLVWRWLGGGEPSNVPIRFEGPGGEYRDSLRFDLAGRAELSLPPGVYRYTVPGDLGQGLVAVEAYSDEWRPRPVTLTAQSGAVGGAGGSVALREHWWPYVVLVAALVAEWAWRRREGLP